MEDANKWFDTNSKYLSYLTNFDVMVNFDINDFTPKDKTYPIFESKFFDKKSLETSRILLNIKSLVSVIKSLDECVEFFKNERDKTLSLDNPDEGIENMINVIITYTIKKLSLFLNPKDKDISNKLFISLKKNKDFLTIEPVKVIGLISLSLLTENTKLIFNKDLKLEKALPPQKSFHAIVFVLYYYQLVGNIMIDKLRDHYYKPKDLNKFKELISKNEQIQEITIKDAGVPHLAVLKSLPPLLTEEGATVQEIEVVEQQIEQTPDIITDDKDSIKIKADDSDQKTSVEKDIDLTTTQTDGVIHQTTDNDETRNTMISGNDVITKDQETPLINNKDTVELPSLPISNIEYLPQLANALEKMSLSTSKLINRVTNTPNGAYLPIYEDDEEPINVNKNDLEYFLKTTPFGNDSLLSWASPRALTSLSTKSDILLFSPKQYNKLVKQGKTKEASELLVPLERQFLLDFLSYVERNGIEVKNIHISKYLLEAYRSTIEKELGESLELMKKTMLDSYKESVNKLVKDLEADVVSSGRSKPTGYMKERPTLEINQEVEKLSTNQRQTGTIKKQITQEVDIGKDPPTLAKVKKTSSGFFQPLEDLFDP